MVQEIWSHIGITGAGALGVLIATAVLYVVLVVILRVSGPRLLSSPSVLSWALMALIGSMTARAMLGGFPTLGGAAVALATLLVLEGMLGRLGSMLHRGDRLSGAHPAVVMIQGSPVGENLRRRRMTEAQLRVQLRRAGILALDDAALVVLETRGSLTIVRARERIDAELLEGVRGRDLVPPQLLTA